MQNKNQSQPANSGDVTHPAPREWMEYLYGEVSRKQKKTLAAHLKQCEHCRAEVTNWQGTMLALDDGKSKVFPARPFFAQPVVKWGIAAAFILLVGFGAGRLSTPTVNAAAIKSQLRSELLADLKQQQDSQFTAFKLEAEKSRLADNKAMVAAFAAFRNDLERVAVSTQDSFQRQEQQIVNLGTFAQQK